MKGLKSTLLLISALWVAASCDPLESLNEKEKEPDPIDRIIGNYDMYVSMYISFYTVGESTLITDTVDLEITKMASDAAELVSEVMNTTAVIDGSTLSLKTSTEILSFDEISGYLEFSYRNIIYASDVLQFTSDIQGEMSGAGKTLPLSGVMSVKAIKKTTTKKER